VAPPGPGGGRLAEGDGPALRGGLMSPPAHAPWNRRPGSPAFLVAGGFAEWTRTQPRRPLFGPGLCRNRARMGESALSRQGRMRIRLVAGGSPCGAMTTFLNKTSYFSRELFAPNHPEPLP
jgi:hypothetical protein